MWHKVAAQPLCQAILACCPCPLLGHVSAPTPYPPLQISEQAAFYASAGAGLAGFILTALFLPDTTGLDLHEIDRMSRYLLAGHYRNYHGGPAGACLRAVCTSCVPRHAETPGKLGCGAGPSRLRRLTFAAACR